MSRPLVLLATALVACSSPSESTPVTVERPGLVTRDIDAGATPASDVREFPCGKIRTATVAPLALRGPFFIVRPAPHILASGRVVVGDSIYDPSVDAWGPLPGAALAVGNAFGSCVWMRDDSVACVGGNVCGAKCTSYPSQRAHVLDARLRRWSEIPSMHQGRYASPFLRLSDGRLAIIGKGTEIYDPSTNVWTEYREVAGASNGGATATLLPDDRILVAGGFGVAFPAARVELFDARTGKNTVVAPMSVARTDHSAVRLRDGRVLVVGGAESLEGPSIASTEIFDPSTGRWSTAAPLPRGLRGVGLIATSCGGAVAIGGIADHDLAYPEAWTWDATTNKWTFAVHLQHPRGRSGVAVLEDRTALVVSGGVSIESLTTAERLFVE